MSDLPNVIVVGAPQLAEVLAGTPAEWKVYPASPTIDHMWDSFDNGSLPSEPVAIIFTEGTGLSTDDLELALAAFAPMVTTFLVALPNNGEKIIARAKELAPSVDKGDANAPIYFLPSSNLQGAFEIMRNALVGKVVWPAPVVQAPASPPAVRTPVAPQQVAVTPVAPADSAVAYEQSRIEAAKNSASVYSEQVAQQAREHLSKRADAIPGQVTIACMSSKGGSGKCNSTLRTFLNNPITGELKSLAEALNDNSFGNVLSFDGRFISSQKINDKIYSGEKETFKVLLRSGKSLSVTKEHPILTTSGWYSLEDIQVGESLATPSKMPFPIEPIRLNNAELDILALIMAEGGTSQDSTGFTSNDSQMVNIMRQAVEKIGLTLSSREHPMQFYIIGNVPVTFQKDKCSCGCGRDINHTSGSTIVQENPNKHWTTKNHWLRQFRLEHGLEGTLAKNKTMPKAVYRLPEDQLARFISLFWMCDGYVSVGKNGGGDVGITLASKELVYAFQHLLLRFGILSSVNYKKAKAGGKEFDAWRLIVQAPSFKLLRDKIGLWDYKGENLQILIDRAEKNGSNPNLGCPTFDDSVYQELLKYQRPGLTKEVLAQLGWNVAYPSTSMVLYHKATKGTGRKHLNLKGMRAWCELAGPDAEREFGWIYDSEIAWDDIVSIESEGINPVGDLEIPGTHNFVANDIIVHNSTTSICLAATIAKTSAAAGKPKKVVLVDLDTRDGQIGSMIGKYMPTAVSIRVMPEWDAPTVLANLVSDRSLGIDCLLAPVRPRNADDVGPDFYRQIIQVLQTTHDVVILDCSVNYLDALLGVGFALSDEILFVTTVASTSVEGMARALTELFADPEQGGLGVRREKVGIVANAVINNVGMGQDKLLRAALGAPLVGQIPADYDLVLTMTNHVRMGELIKNPRLGNAYFKLAKNCLPDWDLVSIVPETVAVEKPAAQERKRLFNKS